LTHIELRAGGIHHVTPSFHRQRFQVESQLSGSDLPHDDLGVRSSRDRHISIVAPHIGRKMSCINSATVPVSYNYGTIRTNANFRPWRDKIPVQKSAREERERES